MDVVDTMCITFQTVFAAFQHLCFTKKH